MPSSSVCATGNVINATPADYQQKLAILKPGDRLVLASGTYDANPPGLPIFNLNGTAAQPIVITGPESGPRPILLGNSAYNTIRFDTASYVAVCNIEIDGHNAGGDGVNAQGVSHHIVLDNLYIHGVGSDQQIVGISTKAPVWNWVIRRSTIVGAGTGLYLGNSTGDFAFVGGVIENNLIIDTIGYNVQIKYQNTRDAAIPASLGAQVTLIRNNVFRKVAANSATASLARPNLLVDHFPLVGPGMTDRYEIYGNLFWQNPTEALFQGNGNVVFHDNLLVNDSGAAVVVQPHDGGSPRDVLIYGNTIVASSTGINVSGAEAGYVQKIWGNAVFAATPINAPNASDNATDTRANAVTFLNSPFSAPGAGLDLYSKPAALSKSTPLDVTGLSVFVDYDKDFNGTTRNWLVRGAYAGEGTNPGWAPAIAIKP